MKELILGGARSGKSGYAQQCAIDSGLDVIYIATATAQDEEMAQRIARHQQDRPGHWQVIEEPVALTDTLNKYASDECCILVDCLTLWLSNLLTDNATQTSWQREREKLLTTLSTLPGQIFLVSNEVGMGIIPMGELNRTFCDEAGRLHQALAQICDRVTLMVAGIPTCVKGE